MTDTPKGTLFQALRDFQADAPDIPLDSSNPHFKSKFASLPSVSRIVRPKLAEHGLVWTTMPSQDGEGRPTLKYKLAHAASGECEAGEMPLLLIKSDPQGLGSALTYARRYALLSVLGLVGDDDDDGNHGSGRQNGSSDGKAFGPEADPGVAIEASLAVIAFCGGDRDLGLERWVAIKRACGGYLPHAVAVAFLAAAGTPQAPDPDMPA